MDSLLSGEVLLWPQSKLELNPMHVYTDASPVKVNGTYSQVSVDRISALIVPMHCCVTPSCIMLLWCGKWPQEGNIWQNISQKMNNFATPLQIVDTCTILRDSFACIVPLIPNCSHSILQLFQLYTQTLYIRHGPCKYIFLHGSQQAQNSVPFLM